MDTVSRKPEDLLALADLHPELEQWLQTHPSPQPSFGRGVDHMRDVYEEINRRYLDTLTAGITGNIQVEDRTVSARDGYEISIRIYRSAASTTPGPLIINIHGGAKLMGTLTDEEGHSRIFAHEFNAVCINIAYRLAPEYKAPIQVYDCWDVVQWAATHANEIGANPTKGFIIQGSSAGAQLADIMGHLSRDFKLSPPITGLVEICTNACQYAAIPDQHKANFLSWIQDFNPPGIPREGLLRFYELTTVGGAKNSSHHFNSPLLWPGGHKGLPPVFLQVHGRDHVRDSALIYEDVLRGEGVDVRMKVYPGVPHGFNTMFCRTEVAREHEKDTLEGIRWLLGLSD